MLKNVFLLVAESVDSLTRALNQTDQSVELLKKLGGGGGSSDNSGVFDVIDDLNNKLKYEMEK